MNKKKPIKRTLAVLLSAMLLLTILPVSLLAEQMTKEIPEDAAEVQELLLELPESETEEEGEMEEPDAKAESSEEEPDEPQEENPDSKTPEEETPSDEESQESSDEEPVPEEAPDPENESETESQIEESANPEETLPSNEEESASTEEEPINPAETESTEEDPESDESAEATNTDTEEQLPQKAEDESTQGSEELPASDEIPANEEVPEIAEEQEDSLKALMAEYGYAYVRVSQDTPVYTHSDCSEEGHFFTVIDGILLVTAVLEQEDGNALRIWFVSGDQFVCAYVREEDLDQTLLTPEEIEQLSREEPCEMVFADVGELLAFVVEGEAVQVPVAEETPEVTASVGDFVSVTIDTRAFTQVDDAANEDDGEFFDGYFIRSAPVQIKTIQKDSNGRVWYEISYLMGPEESGLYYNTILATTWVLAEETEPTSKTQHEPTDYAFNEVPTLTAGPMLLSFSPTAMSGFTLKDHSGGVTTFSVGESGLYATSGHDNEYPQLAKSAEDGTMYATPHYLGGNTVYCLEHTMDSPAVRDNPAGPFEIVDIAGYKATPGVSKIIFQDRTLHAIGWIIKHSWPFQVLNRTDTYNNQWTRVAAQFAMRTLIQEVEGDKYVRDYWEMDDFYATKEGAPAVYLKYARWLAENAIIRAEITGKITVSNQTLTQSGSTYTGKAKLITDADLMRIRKSAGTVKGHSGGSDDTYYYLNSGDTISITSKKLPFSITVESVSEEDEEANFLMGVPSADIQKIIIPQYGEPPAIQSTMLTFDMPTGTITVMKFEPEDGIPLPGAVFELLSGTTVLSTQTTGSDGIVTFSDLDPGTYSVREKTAPAGYALDSNPRSVTVTGGETSNVVFTDMLITGKIRIVKTDSMTGEPLAGVQFSVIRLTTPVGCEYLPTGTVIATLTTDSQGIAETELLPWGEYRIEEITVPEGYAGAVTQTVQIQ